MAVVMETDLKVLLLTGNNFSNQSNNGKTFEAIFKNFPKANLSQLYSQQVGDVDFEFCQNYYRISIFDGVKNIFNPWHKVGKIILKVNKKDEERIKDEENRSRKKIPSSLGGSRELIWKLCNWFSKDLKKWIENNHPDFIFVVPGKGIYTIEQALKIQSYFKIPIVTYITDDYVFSPLVHNIYEQVHQKRLKRAYQNLVNKSTLCYCIGDLMAQFYEEQFGRHFSTLIHCKPINEYIDYPNNLNLNLSYLGGLSLNRWKMLVRLAKNLPSNCRLNVYSISTLSLEIKSEFDKANILFHGAITKDEVENVLYKSDMLVHVESDDATNRAFTRFSISTKIPEYLMTGRPILAFGPEEVASMRIFSDNKIGYQINSEESDKVIQKKIKEIITNYDERKEMGLKGYKYASEHFNTDKMTSQFNDELKNNITTKNV